MYCFHSAPFFAITSRLRFARRSLAASEAPVGFTQPLCPSQDATFTLHDGRLTVDGSFITEAHFIAKGRKEGELVHAVFWANELKCGLSKGISPRQPR